MKILVLGGTAWLGDQIVRAAVAGGHEVTALARGQAGSTPAAARFVAADRTSIQAYAEVAAQQWDGVIDVARQPGQVRSAVAALAARTRTWVFVSSCNVYARQDRPAADESAELLPPLSADEASLEEYGAGKAACEQAVVEAMGLDRCVLARSGLITGPGDHTDRTGYWPLRFARPASEDSAVLVPTSPRLGTQVIDARDLAAWLVHCIEDRVSGAYNAAGPIVPLDEHIATARAAAGHEGMVVPVDQDWLVEHDVEPWSGPRSMPIWLPLPEYAGFSSRDASAALAVGLRPRPLADSLRDTLAWELTNYPDRVRKAGLSPLHERGLLAAARTD